MITKVEGLDALNETLRNMAKVISTVGVHDPTDWQAFPLAGPTVLTDMAGQAHRFVRPYRPSVGRVRYRLPMLPALRTRWGVTG